MQYASGAGHVRGDYKPGEWTRWSMTDTGNKDESQTLKRAFLAMQPDSSERLCPVRPVAAARPVPDGVPVPETDQAFETLSAAAFAASADPRTAAIVPASCVSVRRRVINR